MNVKQEVILMFRIDDEKRRAMETICFQMGMTAVEVAAEEENAPLGLLAGAEGWRNPLLMENTREVQPLTEEMLVIAGLSEESLEVFLAKLRQYGATVSLKAVLTQQNAVWNAGQLQGELKRERAEFFRKSEKRE